MKKSDYISIFLTAAATWSVSLILLQFMSPVYRNLAYELLTTNNYILVDTLLRAITIFVAAILIYLLEYQGRSSISSTLITRIVVFMIMIFGVALIFDMSVAVSSYYDADTSELLSSVLSSLIDPNVYFNSIAAASGYSMTGLIISSQEKSK